MKGEKAPFLRDNSSAISLKKTNILYEKKSLNPVH